MLLKEEASNFLVWDFKNERPFTNGLHYFNEREQD